MTILRRALLVSVAVLLSPMVANAVPIGLGDFDGTENLIDFNAETIGGFAGSFTTAGVTVTPESGNYSIQPAGGGVIGTTGAAFNTTSSVGDGDVTIIFDDAISTFGVNFGTSASATLSAVVSAFDSLGNLVESQAFPSFSNSFVGFDFSTAVTSVLIDRTDTSSRFTFVDDIRYVTAAVSVPEPGTLALLGIGLLGMGAARRKKA